MTFEQLQKANEVIKTTDLGRGKEYAEVNQRVKAFRMLYPEGAIITELVSNENGVVIFKAVVKTDEGQVIGTGTAYEKENSTFINKTSYIENCETSAVGRALAMCGIGIDTSIASAEEVQNAQANQKADKPDNVKEAELKAKVLAYINRHNMTQTDINKICKAYNIKTIQELTTQHCMHYIGALTKKGKSIDE